MSLMSSDQEESRQDLPGAQRNTEEVRQEKAVSSESATRKFNKDEIMAAIKERAAELGRAPKRGELIRVTPISPSSIDRQFGSYRNALRECGLEREGCGIPVKLDNLFHDWARVVREMGKIPTVVEYGQRSDYSHTTLRHRYGSWNLVPGGMLEYARENGLEKEWADVLETAEKHCREAPKRGGRPKRHIAIASKPRVLKDRPVYGAPMMRQVMGFAPVNEMGVVFLFGALAEKLGFIVTWVGTQYPDVEAFREVAPGRWQRVRVEIEFQSRNFLQHFHDPKECDLIVCWEHNWAEAPMEVISLQKCLESADGIAKAE